MRGARPHRAFVAGLICAASSAFACSGSPEPLTTPPAATDARLEKQLRDAYEGWAIADVESQDCTVYFGACVDAFARRAGVDPTDLAAKNPRAFMSNPDPTWITGWDALPTDDARRHVTLAAMTYAATLRVFFQTCRADADRAAEAREAQAARIKSELEGLEVIGNPYTRIGRLVALRSDLKRTHPDPIGPRYELELALFGAFKTAQRELVYKFQNQRVDDAASLRPALLPEDERDLLCLQRGAPSFQDPESLPVAYVRSPIDEKRKAQLLERSEAAKDLMTKLPAGERTLAPLSLEPLPTDGTRALLERTILGAALVVRSARPHPKDPKTLVVVLAGTARDKDVLYDCKDTSKLERVRPGTGTVDYERQCKRRDEEREIEIEVHLAETPDVPIEPGEQLTFVGTVKKAESKVVTQKPVHRTEIRLQVDGEHVFEIWRDRLLLAGYFSG